MLLKPVTSEKAVKLIDLENTLVFAVERRATKKEIKKEIETLFNVKIKELRTHIRNNEKFVYVKLAKEFPAVDLATKLGVI